MFKRIKDFFTVKPCTLAEDMTEEEWQELLKKARQADQRKKAYMEYLKKNDPEKYNEISITEQFTMGL